MILGRPIAPKSITEWLERATQDLVPSAQVRVGSEIVEHYNEAVAAHIKNGLTAAAAQTQALADLGEPWVAAKRFCLQYLTQEDAALIEKGKTPHQIKIVLFWNFFMILQWDSFRDHNFRISAFWVGVLFLQLLLFIFLVLAAARLTRQTATLAIQRRIILLKSINQLNIFLAYLVLCFAHNLRLEQDWIVSRFNELFMCALFVFVFLQNGSVLLYYHRLRQKLNAAGETSPTLVPPNPPAAA